jgi:hypothetical protein
MKKNWFKMVLDLLMLIILLLMYSKMSISMTFHEIGGLAVCGLFLIHMGVNSNWISGVTKKLFSKNIPTKTKIGYVVNVLFLLSIALIAISGIMISKIVFKSISSPDMIWKQIHYFSSAVSLILLGVHVGLHREFIATMVRKMIHLPALIAKPIYILLIVGITAFGCYSAATSNVSRWISLPFTASGINTSGQHASFSQGEEFKIRPQGNHSESNQSYRNGNGQQNGKGVRDSGFDIGRAGSVIGIYGSISFIFAVLTSVIERLLKRKRRIVVKT